MKNDVFYIVRYIPILFILLILGAESCSPVFISPNFENITQEHKSVAVLPVEMIYTGIRPEMLSDEDLEEIEIAESKSFQISFFNEVLYSASRGKNEIRIDLQDYQKTNRLLEDNGVGILESWTENPEYLAEILEVDAVVRARIEKTRLMSDFASFGIELGAHILDEIMDHSTWLWLPYGGTKSKEVHANYSLLNKENGTVLWSVGFDTSADWRQKANEIIDGINRRAARKFPYRITTN